MADPAKLRVDIQRSPLGRARGLGASKSGSHEWWVARVLAVALVPLSLWLLFSILGMLGASQAQVAAWAGYPVNTVLLLAFLIAAFHHMQLGVQATIEDYVHGESARIASLLALKGATALVALGAIVAVLNLAFTRIA